LRNEDSSLLEPKVVETNFSLQPEHLAITKQTGSTLLKVKGFPTTLFTSHLTCSSNIQ